MTTNPTVLSKNQQTVASYEQIARDYARDVSPTPSESGAAALRRLVDVVPAGGGVLEVGSGPGWDADFIEALGVAVRRTDVTKAFIEFQTERGKRAELLDLITDDLGGPYDAVMALAVLIHIDRELTDSVLRKIAAALRPGGAFLVSVREGTGDRVELGDTSGQPYYVTLWTVAEFAARLAAAGLGVEWSERSVGDQGPWQTLLATKIG